VVGGEETGGEEAIQLGGSIELSGFRDIDGGSMIVVKKIVGSYVRKFSDRLQNFQKFSLGMKKVHSNESNSIFELHGHILTDGRTYAAEASERNLFVAVDTIMKKLENSIE
jgi:ribosome-associated translation inhibitor RaiA